MDPEPVLVEHRNEEKSQDTRRHMASQRGEEEGAATAGRSLSPKRPKKLKMERVEDKPPERRRNRLRMD
jgi:hypothetical protein